MRMTCALLLSVCLAQQAAAETYNIGGRELQLPAPDGFFVVTPEMDGAYRLSQTMGDELNDQIGVFIPDELGPVARSGQMPALVRYFAIKVNKETKGLSFGVEDFAQLRREFGAQVQQVVEAARDEAAAQLAKNSQRLSADLDTEVKVQLGAMTPLAPHLDDEHALAYSMHVNMLTEVNGTPMEVPMTMTMTVVNVAGKVLFLYGYGSKDDLDWTRSASDTWARKIIERNAKAEPGANLQQGINWGRALERGLLGAIIGGIIGLVLYFVPRLKKARSKT